MTENEKLECIIRCFLRRKEKAATDNGACAPSDEICGNLGRWSCGTGVPTSSTAENNRKE